MSQMLFPFQAEIHGKTWYIETYGDTKEQARDEAVWSFKGLARVPITDIKKLRIAETL